MHVHSTNTSWRPRLGQSNGGKPAKRHERSQSLDPIILRRRRASPALPGASIRGHFNSVPDAKLETQLPASCRTPSDVLHQIFFLVLPPEDMLNPSLHCGPDSAWCHAMVAKRVSVCKAWYWAAALFLYRDISLRRVRQVGALHQTLTAKPALGTFVRSINLVCYVPPSYCQSVGPDMEEIVRYCPAVTSFNHLPPFSSDEMDEDPSGDDDQSEDHGDAHESPAVPEDDGADGGSASAAPCFLDLSFPSRPSTVTSLTFGEAPTFEDIEALRQCSGHLEELSTAAFDHECFDVNLSFPSLRTLNLTFHGSPTETFGTRWAMPQLRRLTFLVSPAVASTDDLAEWYHHFLTLYGHQLEYVAFPDQYSRGIRTTQHDSEDVGPLLKLCPVVEHVVLSEHHAVAGRDASFPTVKWLDVWHSNIHWFGELRTSLEAPEPHHIVDGELYSHFPNVAHARFLDTALSSAVADVPHTFDRDVCHAWTLVFPGLSVLQVHVGQRRSRVGVLDVWATNMQAANSWATTDFGANEMEGILHDQREFQAVVRSGAHAARDQGHTKRVIDARRRRAERHRMIYEFWRLRFKGHAARRRLGRRVWEIAIRSGLDDESEDENAFDELELYPDSEDDRSEGSCDSVE
ncbi:hypothetical protein B0H19DRAFT_1240692, partial [Mycena capillaripes]